MRDALKNFPYEEIAHVHSRDFGSDPPSAFKIVGNLPFGIATPLHLNWLRAIAAKHAPNASPLSLLNPQRGHVVELLLMFQKEVAQRICSRPGANFWGRLGVISQIYCDVRLEFEVPAAAFTPIPKVDAALVRLTAKENSLAPSHFSFDDCAKMTSFIFQYRNKQIQRITRYFSLVISYKKSPI